MIRGLKPGSYTVSFSGQPSDAIVPRVNLVTEYYNNSYSWSGATPVNLTSANATNINATLEVGRTISGTVTLPGGVDTAALKGIDVYADGASGEWAYTEVDTGTGAYTIYGLAPAVYTLEFSSSDWWNEDYSVRTYTPLASIYYGGSYTAGGSTTVDVTTVNATGKNQLMVVGRTISGTVTLGSGADAVWKDYLNVYAENDTAFRSAKVDPTTGAYTVKGLAPGSYTLNFEASGRYVGSVWTDAPFAFEYYNNQRSPYSANAVNVTSANASGINATMDLQVGNRDFWLTPKPTVTGTPAVGQTLTAVTGTWEPYAESFTYQWKRNGASIAGATAANYAVTLADAGTALTVEVTGSAAGYNAVSKPSDSLAVPLLPFTTAPEPTVTGTAAAGQVLTAVEGTWSPAATFTYQWKRNGTNIGGATGKTYTATQADATNNLTVTVTGSATGYQPTSKTSVAVPIVATPFTSAPAPGVTGTHEVGSTLTGNVGTWSPAATFTYAWLRNGDPIPGATGTNYTLVEDDGGQYITFTVTGSAAGYATTTRLSGAIVPTGHSFTATAAPTITGTFKVGKTLTASTEAWTPVADFSYEWLRDGEPIDAYGATYELAAADYGHQVSVRVAGILLGYEREQTTSTATTVAIGTFSATPTPTISGSAYLGATLTAKVGTWAPTPSAFTYQWYRSGKAISGATKSTYKLTSSDSGKKITVKVTGKSTGYTSVATTSAAKTLSKFFTKAGTASISGTVKVGNTVKASVGTWSPKPSSYAYQWYRSGVAISGATKSSYKVAAADAGKKLTVKVTAKRSGYASTPKTSAAKTVANGTFSKAPAPKITGTVKVGSTLKFTRGTWSPTPSSYSYQWYRSGSAISGATGTSYKLVAADKGKTITVKVTAKKTGYTTKSATSAKTTTVK
ncbi:MAG: hypothetical protein NVV57_09690 [Demequina sp.]|nr:hypothetical protein [Demequina sp.]